MATGFDSDMQQDKQVGILDKLSVLDFLLHFVSISWLGFWSHWGSRLHLIPPAS